MNSSPTQRLASNLLTLDEWTIPKWNIPRGYSNVLIPTESGERVSFIVALELSMIFIQQAVDSYVVPAGQDRNFPFIRTVIIGKRFISALLPEFGPDMTHMSKSFSKPCDLADEFHFDDNFSTI